MATEASRARKGKRFAGRLAASVLITSSLAGCMVGPDYVRPSVAVPTAYKEMRGWKPARPADDLDRGAWWRVIRDPTLDKLERQVVIGNQNLAQAEAAYRQAKALVGEAKAGLFPTVTGTGDVTRQNNRGIYATTSTAEAAADWELDLWGRIRRDVESQTAAAQAGAADVASAQLSAEATLATLYIQLRYQDSLKRLLADTVVAYQHSLEIVKNQNAAGITSPSDVYAAQTQLENAQAALIGVDRDRATYEHAIAVLMGLPPADVSIARGALPNDNPNIPVSVPSTLLERRPDIAAAERRMQAANAQIGVATAAFFPDISLSGAIGAASASANLFHAAKELWSIAASGAQTLFDGGLRAATVEATRAAYEEAVASYRQTVLTAFQNVEDDLSSTRVLRRQLVAQQAALRDARQSMEVALREYQAGTTAYTTVLNAQTTTLATEQAVLALRQARLLTTVDLVKALGGGWSTKDLPSATALAQAPIHLLPTATSTP
jgi:NodT family efflux transporter outer membrane factor (OMF) lipoprotein